MTGKDVVGMNALRAYKEETGLSSREIAEKLGMSKRQFNRYLKGQPMPPVLALYTEHFLGIEKEKLVFTPELLQEVMYD